MGESHRLEAFAEDLAVFHQLTTADERAEFAALMKRAYAQHMSACVFVQRSPERRVSTHIRDLCEKVLAQQSTTPVDNTRGALAGGPDESTDRTLQQEL